MVESNSNKNKLIIKNTLLLYARMFFIMIISLFTSRIVLQTLGVEDYGIYGVVGGIVSIMGFLNSSMSASTSRYITFELGQGNVNNLRITFNNAFWVHFIIAIIVIVIAETIGLWFLVHQMVIPEDRMFAAHWVYQLSVISVLVGFTQTPYSACIIAHEHINIYAYAELVSALLKLLIVYLLVVGNYDKLILYSILMFLISVGIVFFYRLYCIRYFKECHISFVFDKPLLKRMLVFSGWDLFGNLSVSVRNQGLNMILNMFFGVVVNAAASIAGQVSGVIMSFGSNILFAVKPQITKSYAIKDYERTNSLIRYSAIGIMYMLALFSLPLIVEMKYVLFLWLGTVPLYSVTFCRLVLLFNFFSALAMLMLTIPHAAEKNKYPSLVNGTIYILSLPISYLVFRYYHIVWFSYLYNVLSMFCGFLFITFLATLYLPNFSFHRFFFGFFLKNAIIFVIIYYLLSNISYAMEESFYRLVIISLVSSILVLLSALFIGMDINMRRMVFSYLKRRFSSL